MTNAETFRHEYAHLDFGAELHGPFLPQDPEAALLVRDVTMHELPPKYMLMDELNRCPHPPYPHPRPKLTPALEAWLNEALDDWLKSESAK